MRQDRTHRFCFFSKLRTGLSLNIILNIFLTTMMYLTPEKRITCAILSCLSETALAETSELGISNLFNTEPPLQTRTPTALIKVYGGARCMLMTTQLLLNLQDISTADAMLIGTRMECMLLFMLAAEYIHRPPEERRMPTI